jgi:peroxiredoxin
MLDTHETIPRLSEKAAINHLSTTAGDSVLLQAKGKTTVIYFFAPWCQVCHASIGNLQTIFQNNEHVDVIAVALDYTSSNEVMNFTKKHQLTFPVALGNTKTKQTFAITGYPSYYVLDENNVITAKSMGYSSQLGLYFRSL